MEGGRQQCVDCVWCCGSPRGCNPAERDRVPNKRSPVHVEAAAKDPRWLRSEQPAFMPKNFFQHKIELWPVKLSFELNENVDRELTTSGDCLWRLRYQE